MNAASVDSEYEWRTVTRERPGGLEIVLLKRNRDEVALTRADEKALDPGGCRRMTGLVKQGSSWVMDF